MYPSWSCMCYVTYARVCCAQGTIAVMQVDLADLSSVRALAKAFQACERGPDLLVSARRARLQHPMRSES